MTDVINSKSSVDVLYNLVCHSRGTALYYRRTLSRTSIIGKSLTTQDRGVIEFLSYVRIIKMSLAREGASSQV